MANSNKPKLNPDDEKPVIQLTSHQLVLSLAALILVVLFVFVTGTMVQKYDRSKTGNETTASIPATNRTPANATSSTAAPTKPEGVQISPRPVTDATPPKDNSALTEASLPHEPSTAFDVPAPPPTRGPLPAPMSITPPVDTSTKPKVVELPKPTPEKPVEPAKPAEPKPVDTKVALKSDPAPSTKATTPPTTITQKKSETESKKPEKTTTPTTSTMPESTTKTAEKHAATETGPFTVQVASYGAKNRAQADKFVAGIKSKSDFEVTIQPSVDGKLLRVCIGSFPDRASAEKTRNDLRSIKEFNACWVRPLKD